jgi:hypothetical protein
MATRRHFMGGWLARTLMLSLLEVIFAQPELYLLLFVQ